MNEIAKSERYESAVLLHCQIRQNGETAAATLVEFCRGLKKMRDEKLYTELGYTDFGEYAEKAVGIRQRQAYSYIAGLENLGEEFLQTNARLGISKIELIARVPAVERDEFLEAHDVESATVRELKAMTERYTKAAEQASLFEQEAAELKAAAEERKNVTDAELIRARNKLEKAEREREQLEKQAEELRREVERLGATPAEPDLSAITAAREEGIKQGKLEAAKKAEKAEAKHRSELERLEREKAGVAEQLGGIQAQLEAATAESERLRALAGANEKRLAAAGDDALQKAGAYFEMMMDCMEKLEEAIDGIADSEIAQKLRRKIGAKLARAASKLMEEEDAQ